MLKEIVSRRPERHLCRGCWQPFDGRGFVAKSKHFCSVKCIPAVWRLEETADALLAERGKVQP